MPDRIDNVLNLMLNKKYNSADKLLDNMLIYEKDPVNIDKIISLKKLIASIICGENTSFRCDVLFNLVVAKRYYANKTINESSSITNEIFNKTEGKLDLNELTAPLRIESFGKTISFLQSICFMYAGIQILELNLNVGVDFSEEWNVALKI